MIESADQETLQNLLIDLVERQPELVEWIETRLSETEDASNGAEQPASNINVESIRSQVNYALPSPERGGPRDVHAAFEQAAEDIRELIDQAWTALEANDGETALRVLEAVTFSVKGSQQYSSLPRYTNHIDSTGGGIQLFSTPLFRLRRRMRLFGPV